MVNISSIKLDTAAASQGVWKHDPWGIGFEFCIASTSCKEYVAAVREAARMLDKEGEEAFQRRVSEATARHLLRDWRGLDEPYSYEKSLEFMTAPDGMHLRAWVAAVADTTTEYLMHTRAKAGKA